MKKLSLVGFMVLFLASCSNNEPEVVSNSSPVVLITGYKITSESTFLNGSNPNYKRISIGNLQNGKLFSKTEQNFSGGVSQGAPETIQEYFYNGDLLVMNIHGDSKREFYYDSQNRLIGAKLTLNFNNPVEQQGFNYYRFTHVSNSIVYFQKISKPYDDPTAEILSRDILEFDSNDNLIKVGRDNNFDGVSESPNQFTYLNNNLISSQRQGGTVINYTYSNVIDTFAILNEKSFGKKNSRIICSEEYASNTLQSIKQSKNLLSQEIINNNYEVLANNYYKKKTELTNITDPSFRESVVTEFFFN
jgi:hypothetical protein